MLFLLLVRFRKYILKLGEQYVIIKTTPLLGRTWRQMEEGPVDLLTYSK